MGGHLGGEQGSGHVGRPALQRSEPAPAGLDAATPDPGRRPQAATDLEGAERRRSTPGRYAHPETSALPSSRDASSVDAIVGRGGFAPPISGSDSDPHPSGDVASGEALGRADRERAGRQDAFGVLTIRETFGAGYSPSWRAAASHLGRRSNPGRDSPGKGSTSASLAGRQASQGAARRPGDPRHPPGGDRGLYGPGGAADRADL